MPQLRMDNSKLTMRCGNLHFGIQKSVFINIILAVVFAALILTVIALATSKNKSSEMQKKSSCATAECYAYAAELVNRLNTTINQCDDFYEYSCGKWIREAQIDDTQAWQNSFQIQSLKTARRIREIIERYSGDRNSAMGKARRLYNACLKNAPANYSMYLRIINERIGGWPIAVGPEWQNTTIDFNQFLVYLANLRKQPTLTAGYLFKIDVGFDLLNNNDSIIIIKQGNSLAIPEAEKDIRIIFFVNKARQYGTTTFNQSFAYESARRMIDTINLLSEQPNNANVTNYERMSINKFSTITNGTNWLEYFNIMLANYSTLKSSDQIGVFDLEFFKNITNNDFFNKLDPTSLINIEVENILPYFPAASAVLPSFKVSAPPIQSPREAPRWNTCVQFLLIRLSSLMSVNYAKSYYPDINEVGTVAKKLSDGIFESYKERIHQLPWLDESSKRIALLKIQKMRQNYFFPNWVKDPEELEAFYSNLSVNDDDHWINNINLMSFTSDKRWTRLKKNLFTHKEWPVSPMEANAFYTPTLNSFFITTAILQTPVFDKDRLQVMNFAGLGSIIGHEITHGFDLLGTQFDEAGNKNLWLKDLAKKAFINKSKCFDDQYSRYFLTQMELPSLKNKTYVDGSTTLSENIADNGGIQNAFRAYKMWEQIHGPEVLPDILQNFTNDQVFFMTYSQHWCIKYAFSSKLESLVFGPLAKHSPPKFRVLGPLQNYEEFAKAFICKPNETMNPYKRCNLW